MQHGTTLFKESAATAAAPARSTAADELDDMLADLDNLSVKR